MFELTPLQLQKFMCHSKFDDDLTRDYYDRDKVVGFGNSAIFFPVFIFTSHNKYRPLSFWGSQGVWVLIIS